MKNAKVLRVVLLLLVVFATLFAVACDKNDNGTTATPTTPPLKDPVTLSVELSATKIEAAGAVQATATVTGTDNTAVTWTVDKTDLVAISDNGVITVITAPNKDTLVKVTATSVADPTVSAFRSLIVKAPQIDGQVGDLTSEMLRELGNASITVRGTLTDIYVDYNNSFNSTENAYDILVKMADGAWMGSWSIAGSEDTVVTDNYRRGEDGKMDASGNFGHAMMKVYVDLHNNVASAAVKDYMSIPTIWESQHLWNHIGSLNVNRFEYDPENDVYKYKADMNDEADLYLMTYLSYSLTPMLSDTLDTLYLTVEDGKITKLSAQTEVLLYGDNTEEDPDAMSYTVFEVTFSDIGTTTVDDPVAYEAPDYADKLTAALEKMAAATNYTYSTVDTQTYAAAGDSSDYELSVSGAAQRGRSYVDALLGFSYKNNSSSKGTVGEVGWVTADAVIRAKTGKYTSSMDDKLYHTEYSGYKQNANGTYDEFEYKAANGVFVGIRNLKGNILDKMPKFDMSANIFEYTSVRTVKGVNQYTFTLRDSSITREVAKQLAVYNVSSAEASASVPTQIVVDANGNLISFKFPYSISGIYVGYCETTYTNVGTTVLDEDAFTGYIPRVIRTNWNQYTLTDFYYNFSGSCKDYGCAGDHTPGNYDHSFWTATADVVLKSIYGDNWTNVPNPDALMGIFGDYLNGPFYNWKSVGTDSNGKDINHGYMTITTSSTEFDDNGKITNFEELAGQIKSVMESQGFALSVANSDTTGGTSGQSNRYLTFIKGDVQIVFENNGTRYFWIYFYQTGDWTLRK